MMWRDLLSTDQNGIAHDEEILNVFRLHDDEMLGNRAVAEAVGMSTEGVKKRLLKLRDNDRINGKKVGENWVWTLHSDERRKLVPPDYDRLIHWLDWIDDKARPVIIGSLFWTVLGLSLIYWAVTEALILEISSGISPELMLVAGWAFAGAGSMLAIATGIAVVSLQLIERLAIGGSKVGRPSGSVDRSRGQVSLRTVLGVFVLVVIAGPLAGAAVDIQQSLSDAPAFSGLEAGVIALLVVLAIVATIF